jgi:hypothetical protein
MGLTLSFIDGSLVAGDQKLKQSEEKLDLLQEP